MLGLDWVGFGCFDFGEVGVELGKNVGFVRVVDKNSSFVEVV